MERDRWGLDRLQRVQMKKFICLLGVLLIALLAAGRILTSKRPDQTREETLPEASPHIPVVQTFENVWIMEQEEDGIVIFRDGQRETYPFENVNDSADGGQPYQPPENLREQVADIEVTDGAVTDVVLKTEKINGKVLSADADGVEVEGYGRLPLAENYKGYKLYGSLAMCTAKDLLFGYNMADLCLDNGEICALLLAKEEAMEYIRVLIRTSDFAAAVHPQLTVTSDTGFSILYGAYDAQQTEKHAAGEELVIGPDSDYFTGDRVWIVPDALTGKVKLKSVARSQGTPSYRGKLELLLTDEGIVVINELPMEEYLYSVVPSEMPAKYPEEALKAQAICARTYAYGHMEHAGYPQYGAHVDDSTSYQVYNNILEQESSTTAVKDTYGQLLFTEDGALAQTYYYSTSCGVGSDATVWKTETAANLPYLKSKSLSKAVMTEQVSAMAGNRALPEDDIGTKMMDEETFASFIMSVNEDDFEAAEGWYRWTYNVTSLDTDHMSQVLQARYAANNKLVLTLVNGEYVSKKIGDIGAVKDIYVAKRGSGGVAEELVISAEKGTYKVISEHNIRYVLNDGKAKVNRQDGSEVASPSLLPSGFFIIATGKEDGNVVAYTLAGGGFGHGVGMSQNGARQMADGGFMAEDILRFFFDDCQIKKIYD